MKQVRDKLKKFIQDLALAENNEIRACPSLHSGQDICALWYFQFSWIHRAKCGLLTC